MQRLLSLHVVVLSVEHCPGRLADSVAEVVVVARGRAVGRAICPQAGRCGSRSCRGWVAVALHVVVLSVCTDRRRSIRSCRGCCRCTSSCCRSHWPVSGLQDSVVQRLLSLRQPVVVGRTGPCPASGKDSVAEVVVVARRRAVGRIGPCPACRTQSCRGCCRCTSSCCRSRAQACVRLAGLGRAEVAVAARRRAVGRAWPVPACRIGRAEVVVVARRRAAVVHWPVSGLRTRSCRLLSLHVVVLSVGTGRS